MNNLVKIDPERIIRFVKNSKDESHAIKLIRQFAMEYYKEHSIKNIDVFQENNLYFIAVQRNLKYSFKELEELNKKVLQLIHFYSKTTTVKLNYLL